MCCRGRSEGQPTTRPLWHYLPVLSSVQLDARTCIIVDSTIIIVLPVMTGNDCPSSYCGAAALTVSVMCRMVSTSISRGG